MKENPGSTTRIACIGETRVAEPKSFICPKCRSKRLVCPTCRGIILRKIMKWQESVSTATWRYPLYLYASMVGVIRGNWKEHQQHMNEEQKKTGLRPQL